MHLIQDWPLNFYIPYNLINPKDIAGSHEDCGSLKGGTGGIWPQLSIGPEPARIDRQRSDFISGLNIETCLKAFLHIYF